MRLTIEQIEAMNPCDDGLEWLKAQTDLETAWQECKRGDWMLWVLDGADMMTEKQDLEIQLLVLEMPLHNGGKVIDLITDERSLAFIELKRRKLNGETIDRIDWYAASFVARAAAGDAANAAVREVAWAARDAAWAAAWADARDAAWDAARAVSSLFARYADRTAARTAARAWLADQLRLMFPSI